MLSLILIVALSLISLMLAAALAPLLRRAGQSWPEANPEHTFARPYRAPVTLVRTPRPLRQWARAERADIEDVVFEWPAADDSLGFDLSDLAS